MTRVEAKKRLLAHLYVILCDDDDLFPDDVFPESKEYTAWDAAREELSVEFARRSKGF